MYLHLRATRPLTREIISMARANHRTKDTISATPLAVRYPFQGTTTPNARRRSSFSRKSGGASEIPPHLMSPYHQKPSETVISPTFAPPMSQHLREPHFPIAPLFQVLVSHFPTTQYLSIQMVPT